MRTGFEVELLAPAGSDRQVLADAIAERFRGCVHRSFHMDSEPSPVPGVGVFRHLTPAFDVVDAAGLPVARLVDDSTIEADLAPVPGRPSGRGHRGWFRVLCDDARLLRLVERHIDPSAPLATVLDPVADLFGVRVDLFPEAARVNDHTGATIAVAMSLPAGRERPCEIVTPPLSAGHTAALEALLTPARDLGFVVPREAAVHLHVDGEPFRTPSAFANVVRLFGLWRDPLWHALGTNPACRRLAPLPGPLLELVDRDWTGGVGTSGRAGADGWKALRAAVRAVGITKFADVNLTQLVAERPVRDTVEVRILPGEIEGPAVVARAALVQGLLRRCLRPEPIPAPGVRAAHDPRAALDDLAGVAA